MVSRARAAIAAAKESPALANPTHSITGWCIDGNHKACTGQSPAHEGFRPNVCSCKKCGHKN